MKKKLHWFINLLTIVRSFSMKKIIVTTFFALLMSGCISSDYIGKRYTPTTNVDMYFAEKDIEKNYEVMGEVTVQTDEDNFFISTEKLQNRILEEAKEYGADGVIMKGLDFRTSGTSTSAYANKKSVGVVSQTDSKKMVKALFIKYKN